MTQQERVQMRVHEEMFQLRQQARRLELRLLVPRDQSLWLILQGLVTLFQPLG
jgi:hypothetical protein